MIKKIILGLAFGFISIQTIAQTGMDLNMENAELCNTLECTKKNMDAIDSQIVVLIGKRLAFARRVGELGGAVTIPAAAQTRDFQEQFYRIGMEAELIGYSPITARSIFSMIILQSNLVTAKYHR